VKVLITGAAGQVGRALIASAPPSFEVRSLTRAELDISLAPDVSKLVASWRPALIINAAAYTSVDKAESDAGAAMAINADGPRHLAEAACSLAGCRMLHISTDYVFDGAASTPYEPGAATHPLSVYGRSKLQGERAVLQILQERAVILRTAWVYAPTGRNFLVTMLRLLSERAEVRVVADQYGSPTSARSIAQALWAIAQRPQVRGVLHWADAGTASWYDFAVKIAAEGYAAGLLPTLAQVTPISTAVYPTAARRPANSVLDTRESVVQLGFAPPPWPAALRSTLASVKHA